MFVMKKKPNKQKNKQTETKQTNKQQKQTKKQIHITKNPNISECLTSRIHF